MKFFLIRAIVILFFGGIIILGVKKLNNPVAVEIVNVTPQVQLNNHSDSVSYWASIYSKEYNVPQGILESVFFQESRFLVGDDSYNANIVGDGGTSFGVGQVKIKTAQSVWKDSAIIITGKKLKYDIEFNVKTSAKLLRSLHDKFSEYYTNKDSIWLAALTCYNVGEGAFAKHGKRFNGYSKTVYKRYTTQ